MVKIKQIAINNKGVIVGIDKEGTAWYFNYKDNSWDVLVNIYNTGSKPKK